MSHFRMQHAMIGDPIDHETATNACTDGHVENIALSFSSPPKKFSVCCGVDIRIDNYGDLECIFKSVLDVEILPGSFWGGSDGTKIGGMRVKIQRPERTDSDGCHFLVRRTSRLLNELQGFVNGLFRVGGSYSLFSQNMFRVLSDDTIKFCSTRFNSNVHTMLLKKESINSIVNDDIKKA